MDEDGETLEEEAFVVRPVGFVIPPSKYHRITQEVAEAVAATKRNPTSDARWNVTNQLLDTSTAWLAADPKSPVAGRIAAAKAKVEELRAARAAAQPPLPTDWKRG